MARKRKGVPLAITISMYRLARLGQRKLVFVAYQQIIAVINANKAAIT